MRPIQRNLLAASAVLFACAAIAASDTELEQGLLQALRPVADYKRQQNAGKAIRAYKADGVLSQKPTARIDYVDYYLAQRPTSFLGDELVLVEEEYMTKYVGCCADEGAGVFVRVTSNLTALKKFARENLCRVEEYPSEKDVLKEINFRAQLPPGRYAALQCHVRDEDKR